MGDLVRVQCVTPTPCMVQLMLVSVGIVNRWETAKFLTPDENKEVAVAELNVTRTVIRERGAMH